MDESKLKASESAVGKKHECQVSASGMEGGKNGCNRFLLFVAGLGGPLYGINFGIIAGDLPYLEVTSGLNAGQLSSG